MKINDENNFVSMMAKMIEGLGYDNVKVCADKTADITAKKDNKSYCFKCRYAIDAIGNGAIEAFYKAVKDAGYDRLVYITNSSFHAGAKKMALENNIELWDRNTVDRLYIGVHDSIEDEAVEVKKNNGAIIGIIIGAVIIAVAAAVYFFIK